MMATGDPLLEGKSASGAALSGVVAATADKLSTARTISLSGDVSGFTTFDGTANRTIPCTLVSSGVGAGTYICVYSITVDSKGRVTNIVVS